MIKITGVEHDLGGGFKIRRLLPNRQKRMVGPFIFLDQSGPMTTLPDQNIDVRPHPHIGLSTLSYLYEGQIHHKDSLGCEQLIVPGEVNWMTAGRGISHSERTPESLRGTSRDVHGLQMWVALPDGQEEIAPSFAHYSHKDIPIFEDDDKKINLVAGEGFGLKSPVRTTSPLIFANFEAKKKQTFELNTDHFELAVYMINGEANVNGEVISSLTMQILDPGLKNKISVKEGSKLIIIGGEPFLTPRHIWWNLVSSSKEKIEEAKKSWKDGSFPMVPGETEFIPLPDYK
jgi:redox-sensitive bicupin YhaK (pirin superfamily)